jgi:hypothetical protein
VTEPERATLLRLLRAKAHELEHRFLAEVRATDSTPPEVAYLVADVAFVADVVARLFDTLPSTRNELPERTDTPGG